ncbi:MAG: cyclic pyranopterin monophosphate synthase MoaC [Terricaulis silvestris]
MNDRPDKLSHLDDAGRARMVDVGAKPVTEREAVAVGSVRMAPATLALLQSGQTPKGDVRAVAEIAGVMAAKRTADLIPLCHPLALTKVTVEVSFDAEASTATVIARVKTTAQTGVEMEALTAVSVACLTLYDMLKAVDRDMVIGDIKLMEKRGGSSGAYTRQNP